MRVEGHGCHGMEPDVPKRTKNPKPYTNDAESLRNVGFLVQTGGEGGALKMLMAMGLNKMGPKRKTMKTEV